MSGPEASQPSNPLVSALLSGAAPRPLKVSAARGVLPVSRGDLIRILVALAGDADDDVRAEAVARLETFEEREVLVLLGDAGASPEVLDYFATARAGRTAWQDAVLTNPVTSLATLRRIAPTLAAAQIDQLLLNQTRLIASPDLLEMILSNPSATPGHRARVDEMRKHFLRPAPSRADVSPALPPPDATHEPPAPVTSEARPAGAPDPAAPETPAFSVLDNVNQKILRMNTAEKIQLAFKGTREERTILIKDSSRSVQAAVLESPKLTDQEVEAIARMRSVTEEVLRMIAANRDWMKSYGVVHSLATNPKTPVGIAINLVSRLTTRDLRILTTDRNVPEVIRRQARKVNDARSKSPGGHH